MCTTRLVPRCPVSFIERGSVFDYKTIGPGDCIVPNDGKGEPLFCANNLAAKGYGNNIMVEPIRSIGTINPNGYCPKYKISCDDIGKGEGKYHRGSNIGDAYTQIISSEPVEKDMNALASEISKHSAPARATKNNSSKTAYKRGKASKIKQPKSNTVTVKEAAEITRLPQTAIKRYMDENKLDGFVTESNKRYIIIDGPNGLNTLTSRLAEEYKNNNNM